MRTIPETFEVSIGGLAKPQYHRLHPAPHPNFLNEIRQELDFACEVFRSYSLAHKKVAARPRSEKEA